MALRPPDFAGALRAGDFLRPPDSLRATGDFLRAAEDLRADVMFLRGGDGDEEGEREELCRRAGGDFFLRTPEVAALVLLLPRAFLVTGFSAPESVESAD